jgi:ABC-type uncharacterized transport system substrate-binding protein
MSRKQIFISLILTIFMGLSLAALSRATSYRIGVPKGYSTPIYGKLFQALADKGLRTGENLQIVEIDLKEYQTEAEKALLRREIAKQCDLFFTTGNYLAVLKEIEIKTPLLFVGLKGPEHVIPVDMQTNATGVYKGSMATFFEQSIQFLPVNQRQKLGLIYSKDSNLGLLTPVYLETCKDLGIELVVKDYDTATDIKRVMRDFKKERVTGIILFPPAVPPAEIPELVRWQNELKLPIICQLRESIEKGLLGGLVMDGRILIPNLAEYAFKILKGRDPGQLPTRYYSNNYVINLATVSILGIDIPQKVIDKTEIVGLATKKRQKNSLSPPLKAGNYALGVPSIMPTALTELIPALANRGYVIGKNLRLVSINLKGIRNPKRQQAIAQQLSTETDLLFTTGNTLSRILRLPDFDTPVCFISTKETSALIPAERKNFSGVIRTSYASTIEESQRMMNGAKRMGFLAHSDSGLDRSIGRYRKIAGNYDITIMESYFSSIDEIGSAMKKLKQTNDFVVLHPAGITKDHLKEIIYYQKHLKLPVLSHTQTHIKAGILGGLAVDTNTAIPKLAEYIDKMLQGREPASLPRYYYPGRQIINLRTARILQLEIPQEVLSQAKIHR